MLMKAHEAPARIRNVSVPMLEGIAQILSGVSAHEPSPICTRTAGKSLDSNAVEAAKALVEFPKRQDLRLLFCKPAANLRRLLVS